MRHLKNFPLPQQKVEEWNEKWSWLYLYVNGESYDVGDVLACSVLGIRRLIYEYIAARGTLMADMKLALNEERVEAFSCSDIFFISIFSLWML